MFAPISTYPARTVPAIDPRPDTITAKNCGSVRPLRYGLTTSGASVWPTNILAAAFIDSTAPVPMIRRSAPPTILTSHSMTRR